MPRKKKENPIEIKAQIKVLGHVYEATGSTIAEAITNLKPLKGRGMSVLTVLGRSKVLNPRTTTNLFSPSHTQRDTALKGVINMFSDLNAIS